LKDEIKKTASSNSLTVRTNPISKATASGNSMVLKVLSREKLTASSNSMITRVLQPAKTFTTNNATNSVVQALVAAKQPVTVTENTVNISAYADKAIAPVVNTAIQKWATALKSNGLTLDYIVTSDKAALEKGVTIAFLDADDETTRGNMGLATIGVEDDKEMEFSSLAGLSMSTSTIQLVDLTGQDKLNKDGSITNGNVLKNAQYIVQLNTDGITTSQDQTNVVTHEIGHIFGLDHDDSDSLMTTYYDDADFTGEISSVDAKLAVAYILDKIKK
jgi:predicted Zn-dependent protease with MMP-like domain